MEPKEVHILGSFGMYMILKKLLTFIIFSRHSIEELDYKFHCIHVDVVCVLEVSSYNLHTIICVDPYTTY